jgi:hypothetical protein
MHSILLSLAQVKTEMEETLQRLRKPVDEVQAEVKKRENELQTVLVLSQEFETISAELVTWLAAIEEEQAKEKTVSAVYETVKKQQQEHRVEKITFSVFLYVNK